MMQVNRISGEIVDTAYRLHSRIHRAPTAAAVAGPRNLLT